MSIKKNLITETTLISSVPIAGYAVAYLYQLGYNSVFGLTNDFINISLESVFKALGALSIVLGFVFLVSLFYDVYLKIRPGLKLPILRLFMAVLYLLFMYAIFSDTDYTQKYMLPGFIFLGLVVLIDFISPLLFQWSTKGYLNKIATAQKELESSLHGKKMSKFINNVVAKLPGGVVTYLFVLIFVIFGSYQIGVSSALNPGSYMSTKDGKELLIKKDGHDIVTATIENNFVKQDFKFFRVSEDGKPFEFKKYNGKLSFPLN